MKRIESSRVCANDNHPHALNLAAGCKAQNIHQPLSSSSSQRASCAPHSSAR